MQTLCAGAAQRFHAYLNGERPVGQRAGVLRYRKSVRGMGRAAADSSRRASNAKRTRQTDSRVSSPAVNRRAAASEKSMLRRSRAWRSQLFRQRRSQPRCCQWRWGRSSLVERSALRQCRPRRASTLEFVTISIARRSKHIKIMLHKERLLPYSVCVASHRKCPP